MTLLWITVAVIAYAAAGVFTWGAIREKPREPFDDPAPELFFGMLWPMVAFLTVCVFVIVLFVKHVWPFVSPMTRVVVNPVHFLVSSGDRLGTWVGKKLNEQL